MDAAQKEIGLVGRDGESTWPVAEIRDGCTWILARLRADDLAEATLKAANQPFHQASMAVTAAESDEFHSQCATRAAESELSDAKSLLAHTQKAADEDARWARAHAEMAELRDENAQLRASLTQQQSAGSEGELSDADEVEESWEAREAAIRAEYSGGGIWYERAKRERAEEQNVYLRNRVTQLLAEVRRLGDVIASGF